MIHCHWMNVLGVYTSFAAAGPLVLHHLMDLDHVFPQPAFLFFIRVNSVLLPDSHAVSLLVQDLFHMVLCILNEDQECEGSGVVGRIQECGNNSLSDEQA